MTNVNDLLLQQLNQLEAVSVILGHERDLVSGRDPDALVEMLEKKQQALLAVEHTDKAIRTLVASGESLDNHQKVLDQIQGKLAECKKQSLINEKAVQQSQARLHHLQHLLVEGRQKESMTYDKAGRVSGGSLSKGIKA